MLIPFKEVLATYNLKPRGILHVGAHWGEEMVDYTEAGITNVTFVEARPDLVDYVRNRHEFKRGMRSLQACVSDVTGEMVEFNIASNSQSSSMLKFGSHSKYYPTITMTQTLRLPTITLKDLFAREKIDESVLDFVNLDIQGSELKALMGLGDLISKVVCLYTEVNEEHLYEGCALIGEIDKYVESHGMKRVAVKMTGDHWGDAAYIRK